MVNNFVLNRHWTFDAGDGLVHFQAMRFLVVSLGALVVSLLLLTLLVEGAGLPKVAAQALAVAASMPLNFLGNKLWSFRTASLSRPALDPDGRPSAAVGRGSTGTYTLAFPPLGGSLCRRWSSTASASTWLASSRSCS